MSDSIPPPKRRTFIVPLLVGAILTGAAAFFGWQQYRSVSRDRETAVAFAEAMTAPRVIFDGLPLETRYDAAVEDVAGSERRSVRDVRQSLERYASGGLLETKRVGYDAFLAQLATRRFEIALGTIRELANGAKSSSKPLQPAWRLLTVAAILEFGRGRATAAEPLAQQAFEIANRQEQLDQPAAAALHTVFGATHLSRSRAGDAEPYFRRAVSILRKAEGTDLRDCARVLMHYGQSIAAQGFPEEAETLFGEALGKAAQFRRLTGRQDSAQPVVEETYRKLLRARGLADAEIAQKIGAVMESN